MSPVQKAGNQLPDSDKQQVLPDLPEQEMEYFKPADGFSESELIHGNSAPEYEYSQAKAEEELPKDNLQPDTEYSDTEQDYFSGQYVDYQTERDYSDAKANFPQPEAENSQREDDYLTPEPDYPQPEVNYSEPEGNDVDPEVEQPEAEAPEPGDLDAADDTGNSYAEPEPDWSTAKGAWG